MMSPEKAEFRSALAELISVWSHIEGAEFWEPELVRAALNRAQVAFEKAARKPQSIPYVVGVER